MNRFFALSAALLVIAASLSGCARNARWANNGWDTYIDGGAGLASFVRTGDVNWREQDGTVMADKGGAAPGYLITRANYMDFVLYAEFWVSEDANASIFLRLSDRQNISAANAYEVKIHDRNPDPAYGTGAIANYAKVSPMPKAGGRWNSMEITANGPRVVVKVNGQQTVNLIDRSFFHGPIALYAGSGIVKFRTLQIKPI